MDEILNKHFGYSKLKDKQEEIITSILDGNDTIGVLSTGYGKSVCYQLPYLVTKKNVIISSKRIINNLNFKSIFGKVVYLILD